MQQQLLEQAAAVADMEPGAGELLLNQPPATCKVGKNRLDAEAFLCNYYSSISAAAVQICRRFDVHKEHVTKRCQKQVGLTQTFVVLLSAGLKT